MAGNRVYVQGNYVDVHDNDTVNLNIDKATVSVDGVTREPDAGTVEEAESDSTETPSAETGEVTELRKEYALSKAKCFWEGKTSEFVQKTVSEIVKKFHLGTDANLALLEITLFDHGLLQKRNNHTAFLKSLMAWDILPIVSKDAVSVSANGIAAKFNAIGTTDGYEKWSDALVNEKKTCRSIGQELGQSMPYSR